MQSIQKHEETKNKNQLLVFMLPVPVFTIVIITPDRPKTINEMKNWLGFFIDSQYPKDVRETAEKTQIQMLKKKNTEMNKIFGKRNRNDD